MPFVSKPYLASLSVDQYRAFAAAHTTFGYHPETHDELFIPMRDRYAGTYVLGVQGSGKSGLLRNLIAADMQAGNAVIVSDAHGDLTLDCLSDIPPERIRDTYVLDMEDEAFPFGTNVFSTGRLDNDVAKAQAVNRIMHVFEVLWPEVAAQQNLPRYVRAAAIVFLSNPGTTLVDMHTFLQDEHYRARLLSNVADASVRNFWHTQYDSLGPHEQYRRVQPVIGRLEALFMGRSLVRNIVGQRQNTISFRRAIEHRQIIFIKLPVKTIPQDARLVGSLLLAQLHAAVFSFANVPEAQRPGVSLYIDEFQHFATGDIEELFTEGRKFGVRLAVAHQYRDKLPAYLQAAAMTARTKVCLRLTPEDSREMAHVFPSNEATVQPEDIEVHPVHYLLTHPSHDPMVHEFVEVYLHPLQGMKRGAGRVEIDPWNNSGAGAAMYRLVTDDYSNPRVSDPTHRLDSLLYEVMHSGNPWLPIPPEVVVGFSNCGYGFYRQAMGIGYNDPLLQPDAKFPRHLVVPAGDGELRWTRKPDSGNDQLFHFVFHLRMVMLRLSEEPIGKATSASPADVAKMLTILPNRAAFVRSGETVGVVYTHDTPPRLSNQELYDRASFIMEHTRDTYCHPRQEVEQGLIDANPSATGGFDASQPIKPVVKWEEVE